MTTRPDIEGRTVKIFFNHHPIIFGKVIHAPIATGDSWYIQDNQDPNITIVVHEFAYMTVYPEE